METITINQLIQEIKELKDLLKEKEKIVYTTKELSLLLGYKKYHQ